MQKKLDWPLLHTTIYVFYFRVRAPVLWYLTCLYEFTPFSYFRVKPPLPLFYTCLYETTPYYHFRVSRLIFWLTWNSTSRSLSYNGPRNSISEYHADSLISPFRRIIFLQTTKIICHSITFIRIYKQIRKTTISLYVAYASRAAEIVVKW